MNEPMTLKQLRLSAAAAALAAFAAFTPCAHAGLFDDEEARKAILELRQRMEVNRVTAEQASQRQATAAAAVQTELTDLAKRHGDESKRSQDEAQATKRSLLDLSNQIEQLRAESAKQRGLIEQVSREFAELQRRQRDRDQSLEERLRKLEPQKVVLDGREFFADPSEKREFDTALATFRRGDFVAAETAFSEFLKRFPGTGYVGSALFWLANAQFAIKDFKDSVINFRDLIKRMPDHPRAAEALLGVATSQIELKDTKSARATFTELIAAYPQSEAAATARERMARLR